jgi:hypothetical protein
VPEPLVSGRTWELVPNGEPVHDPHRSELRRLRDSDDHAYTVLFKTPAADAPPDEMYAIGMDRVAYSLGALLELPMPAVFLESFDGNDGALLETVLNEVSWFRFEKANFANDGLVNLAVLPRCVVFDIWIANIDRRRKNMLMQPVPQGTPHDEARRWKLWLIDHGSCALWPPGKFGLEVDRPAADIDLTKFKSEVETIIVEAMPRSYRQTLDPSSSVGMAAIQAVLAISDDEIAGAVNEIPSAYFSYRERELTIQFLQDRRNRIAELCE